jgi:hypothetical protein
VVETQPATREAATTTQANVTAVMQAMGRSCLEIMVALFLSWMSVFVMVMLVT